jgi:DNA-binding transcriptional LysR family regulator
MRAIMQLFDGLTVAVAAEPLAAGVSVVAWSLSGRTHGEGDGVFIDASHASSRWCAVADAIVRPGPLAETPATEAARLLLANGALVAVVPVDQGWWLVRSNAGQEIVVAAPPPGRCHRLTWMAALYGWLSCGQSLASWPCQLTAGAARPTPSSGQA